MKNRAGAQGRRREILEKHDGVLHRVTQQQSRFPLMCLSAWMPFEDCETWEPPTVDHDHVQEIARGILRITEGWDDHGFDGDDIDTLARAYLAMRGASTDVGNKGDTT